jgi:perosamine synthetase
MIPINEPLLDGNEKKYLIECIESGWISSEGPFVKKLEDNFAKKIGRKFAVAVSNGSVAIDASISALGINKGDEVIIPTFTIISCAAPIVRIGAIPVVVDVDLSTWNMCVDQIEKKITPKTKAIMVVHIYGLPVDMAPILNLAQKYKLLIIEDAAEVIGQTYNGRMCGSFGDVSTFSFYPNKHVTTGEGGMIFTDNEEIALKCRELRNLSFIPPRRFVHEDLGWNFRMTNLQAALGVAQLERLDEFIIKKRQIGEWYNELLKEVPGIQLPLIRTEFAENIYWIYGLLINRNVKMNALEAMNKLNELGIGTRPFFFPMHQQPVFKKMNLFRGEICPNAEYLAEKGFYIPSGLALTYKQAEIVADSIKKIFI